MEIHEASHGAVIVMKPMGPLVDADAAQFKSRALELIKTGELKDAKTALAILYVAGFRLGR